MSSRSLAPTEELAALMQAVITCPPTLEARMTYVAVAAAQLKRNERQSTISAEDTIKFLLEESKRMSDFPDMGPAIVVVAIAAELAKTPASLKDASDQLWSCTDRPAFTLAAIPLMTAVFTRVVSLGPPDAFGGVVERAIKTFNSGDSFPKKRAAVQLVTPIAGKHPNLFLARLPSFFSGVWIVAKDMIEQDGGKGAPVVQEAFAAVASLLRRAQVQSAYPTISTEQNEKLKTYLKSRRDVEVQIAIAFMEPILAIRSTSVFVPYSELWSIVWPLRTRDALKYQTLNALVSLARYDPVSFTVDRRTESEKRDNMSSPKGHRNLVMDFVEALWNSDMSLAASQRIIDFYLKLIAVPFSKEAAFTMHQVDLYFLGPLRFKLVSRKGGSFSGSSNAGNGNNGAQTPPLMGCWEILTLLSVICKTFPLSVTVMDAQVAPCIVKILEWGQLAPNLSETLPVMIRLLSPAEADRVLALLLDLVSKTLSGRPFKPKSEALTAPSGNSSQSALNVSFKHAMSKLNLAQLFQSQITTDESATAAAQAAEKTVVALNTLATFGIGESDVMGDFIVQTLLPLLTHPAVSVRTAAIRTIAVLAVPTVRVENGASFSTGSFALPAASASTFFSPRIEAGSFAGSPLGTGRQQASSSHPSSPLSLRGGAPDNRTFVTVATQRNNGTGGSVDGTAETSSDELRVDVSASRRSILHRIINELLSVATTDTDREVRAACLTTVIDTFRHFMTEPASVRMVFHSMVDTDFEVRMKAHILICLLEPQHQAMIAPALRRTLVSSFNRFTNVKLHSAQDLRNLGEVLAVMMRYCPRLSRVYHENVLRICRQHASSFAPPFTNEEFAVTLIKCMSSLATFAGNQLAPADVDFMLDTSTALLGDSVPTPLRFHALQLMSDLVTFTAVDLTSARNIASGSKRFGPLTRIAQDADAPLELRVAALRCFGSVGAVDPDLLQRAISASSGEEVTGVLVSNKMGQGGVQPDSHRAACDLLLTAMSQIIGTHIGSSQIEEVLRQQLPTLMMLLDSCRAADGSVHLIVPTLVDVLQSMLSATSGTTLPTPFFTTMYQLVRCLAITFDFEERSASSTTNSSSSGTFDAAAATMTAAHDLQSTDTVTAQTFGKLKDLILDLWARPLHQCRLFAITLASVIVSYGAAGSAFSVYFRTVVPNVLDMNLTQAVAEAEALIPATVLFLSRVARHLNQFRTLVVNWVSWHFGRGTLPVQRAIDVLRFLRLLSSGGVYLREYAASVLRAVTGLLPRYNSNEFLEEAFALLCVLAKQFLFDFAPFIDTIPRELLERESPPSISAFRRVWASISRAARRGAPAAVRNKWRDIDTTLPAAAIAEFFEAFECQSHSLVKQALTWGQADSLGFVSRKGRNIDDDRRAGAVESGSSMSASQQQAIATVAQCPEATSAYFQRFMAVFVEQSPHLAFQCIIDPSNEASMQLVRAVFFAAFRAAWRRSGPSLRSKLSGAIEQMLETQLQDDIALQLLSLAEHMKMAGEPLDIDVQILSRTALRYEAVAKALHWREESFRKLLDSPGAPDNAAVVEHAEELIMMYGKINSSASAIGLLNVLKLPPDVKEVLTEESLINLKRYAEALAVKKRIDTGVTPRNRSMSNVGGNKGPIHHGRSRSGSDFLDSSFASQGGTALTEGQSRMKCHFMLGDLDAVLGIPLPSEATEDVETARSMVKLAAEAAVTLGRWDTVERTLQSAHLQRDSVSCCVAAAALAVHHRRFNDALALIDRGRQLLVPEVGSLLTESYHRAYESIIVAQQLTELEETIGVLRITDADERHAAQQRVDAVWSKRITYMARDVPSWRRIFSTRTLLIPASRDIANRLHMAQLCSENNMPQLRLACLVEVMGGRKPHPSDLARAEMNADLALNYVDYLMQENHLVDRDRELELLDSMIASYRAQGPSASRALAKLCGLRCSRDRDHLSARTIELTELATKLDPKAASVWRDWADMHTRLLEDRGFHIDIFRQALAGYIQSIQLSSATQATVQDILVVLALWSSHASRQGTVDVLCALTPNIPVGSWLQVIPQLVAKIDFGPERACVLAADIMKAVYQHNPHALMFPLLLVASSDGRRGRLGSKLVKELAALSPSLRLLDDGQMVAKELCRVAKEPWLAAIFAAWEMYTAYCNEPSKAARLRLVAHLHNFHASVSEPMSSAESCFLLRNAATLRRAYADLKTWAAAPHDDAPLHSAFQAYETVYRNAANKVQSRTLDLQFWSPKLFAAKDLEVAVPTHAVLRFGGQNLIHAFQPVVGVISSKQAPRKIQITGATGDTHNFLLKGGEDLRLDERVMQLFDLVNTLLAARHNPSVLRALNIQRYCVTPISSTVGLCGWVDECDTLHELISTDRDARGVPRAPGLEFVLRGHVLPGDPTSANFNHDCTRLSTMQSVEVFEYVCDATSGDDLRRAMWSRGAVNSEQWLLKRLLYMQSLAVMSIVGYILGLGDRHVTNIMIQRTSGKVVHIDFGDCFEVAMNRPTIPEKVPFRLTRMLCNAMDVAQIEGHFRSTSEHVLKTLRDNRGCVLAMLEAFVDDPLVQWRIVTQQHAAMTTTDHEHHAAGGEGEVHLKALSTPRSGAGAEADTADGAAVNGHTSIGSAGSAGDVTARANGALLGAADAGDVGAEGDDDNEGEDEPTKAIHDEEDEAGETLSSNEAFNVIRRIKAKLRGKDFERGKLDPSQQVSRLIKEATDVTNLAQAWVGWHPWW